MAVVALTIGASACSGPKEEAFSRTDGEAIRQISADLAAAFNAKEVDKILALYTDNSVFMPPNAPLLRGREPLKSFYTDLLAGGAPALTLQPEDLAGVLEVAKRVVGQSA